MFHLTQNSLLRLVSELLHEELKNSRGARAGHLPPPGDWPAETSITLADTADAPLSLEADSFEFVALAFAVTRFFQLQDSGLEDYLLRYRRLDEWCEVIAEGRTQGAENIAFASSGTSGPAKICIHQWRDLVQEVAFFSRLFDTLPGFELKRVVTLAPAHHIYGFLFGLLLPDYRGLPMHSGLEAMGMAQTRHLKSGDLLVGYPFIWRQLSRQQARFPEGIVGLTSTAPCDPHIIKSLKAQGLMELVEIYGSSETGGIGYRTATDRPFELLPRWNKGNDGESLRDSSTAAEIALEDRVHWQDERHLTPVGRRDRAVQVGGINVYPQAIAERLESLGSVARALVRPPSDDEGERLKAFIVPARSEQSKAELEAELHRWCRAHLSTPETPISFTFGARLPSGAMGKPTNWTV